MSNFDRDARVDQQRPRDPHADDRQDSGSEQTAKSEAADVANSVKHKAQQTAGEVRDQAAQAASDIKAEAGEAADEVVAEGRELADDVRESVAATVADNKTRAAAELSSVAAALKETGENLRRRDEAAIARYADQLGIQVDQVSRYLRDKELGSMVADVESFARREPGLFIGGAVAVGLLASRFLKSSSPATTADMRSAPRHLEAADEGVPATSSAKTPATPASEFSGAPQSGKRASPTGSGASSEDE